MERSASADEAAAIAAAIQRFVAETAPGGAGQRRRSSPWQRAALVEGVGAKAHDPGPGRWDAMAVVKIIELVGSSKTSTDDAAKQALAQAQGTLRNIRAVDIVSTGIRGENLDEYRAHVRVAFLVEGTEVD